jgi:hypothetical protein
MEGIFWDPTGAAWPNSPASASAESLRLPPPDVCGSSGDSLVLDLGLLNSPPGNTLHARAIPAMETPAVYPLGSATRPIRSEPPEC